MLKFALASTVAAVLLIGGTAAAVPAYTVTALTIDGVHRLSHLNNSGVIAGYAGANSILRDAGGHLTILPTLGGEAAAITSLGDNGAVGLARYDPAPPQGTLEGALWRNGILEPLPWIRTTPDGLGFSTINRISQNGRMAGTTAVNGGFYDDYGNLIPYTHAATFANGQVTDLGTLGGNFSLGYGINDSGTVVGFSTNGDGARRSFIYRNGRMEDMGLADSYAAFDINNAGEVVANSGTSAAGAIVWSDGRSTELIMPGYMFSNASAINNRGDVIGRLFAPSQFGQGFIYTDGAMHLLAPLLDQGGWEISEAIDINDSGVILAQGCQGQNCAYLLLTPIPEPGTWAMLGLGLCLVATIARRR